MPTSRDTDRRAFLGTGVRAALGASLFSTFACAHGERDNGGGAAGADAGADARANAGAAADTGAEPDRPTSIVAELEDRLPRLMHEANVPGLSIALIRRGRISWRHAFGVADNETKAPVTVDTIFEAQSMSKPVFAYAVMKLHERGVLNLDAPLTAYSDHRILEGDPRLDRITARHVLSHTSGLPNWRTDKEPLSIHFTPGERWEYSGEGYWYLESIVTHLTGHVREDVCGTYEAGVKVCASDIEDFMKARLLVPFDMSASAYVWNPALDGRVARPHDDAGNALAARQPTATDVARYGSSGGLLTTPTDYAKFLIEVIAPKPADEFRLSVASRDEMVRPVVKLPDDRLASSWALGWQVFPITNGSAIAHGGAHSGVQSYAAASIDHKSGFVVMMNGDGGEKIIVDTLLSDDWRERMLGI